MSPSIELSIDVLKLYYKSNSLITVIKMMQRKKSLIRKYFIWDRVSVLSRDLGKSDLQKTEKTHTWRLNIARTFGFIAKLKRVVEETP